MSYLEIQSALAQRLNTVSGIPDIYWGATKQTPTDGTPWVRPTLTPAGYDALTFNGSTNDGLQEDTGIYLVSCFRPLGDGEGPLLTLCDAIATHFKAQRTLVEGTTTVYILSVGVGELVVTEAWLQSNVQITYKSIN